MSRTVKLSDGDHVLSPAGGTPRTVTVSGYGAMLTDGDDVYAWDGERNRYECGEKLLYFWIEDQLYGGVDTTPPGSAEAGNWN